MTQTPHIVIADPQYLTRLGIWKGVEDIIPGAKILSAISGEEIWNILDIEKSDILIVDIGILDFTVPNDILYLQKNHPETRILIIADEYDPETISGIWETNVNAFVLKTAEVSEFELALIACMRNQKYFASEIMDQMMRQQNGKKNTIAPNPLTPSEQEIVKLIGQGLTTKEIASQRHLSFHTIITHRRNIFKKLGINNSSELLMYAIRHGIIQAVDYSI